MDAAYLQSLVALADKVAVAAHGEKEALYLKAAEELNKSRATLLAHLKQIRVMPSRKRRCDAGQVALPFAEAALLSGYMMQGYRKNSKKITPLKEALEVLRMNGTVLAAVVDEATGELTYLSESAVSRALKTYRLHPDQLRQATPSTRLRSKHPNHVWQVDASVCVVYYLPDGSELVELDEAVHYKNKPQNLAAIEQFRVIRYVMTDHCSGLIRYRYYPHAESGEHTVRFIAWAMAPKGKADPFQGAPFIIMVDPGATSGGLVRRFCDRMGIQLIVNKTKNARAKGSVEKANHLVETSFEQSLRYMAQRPRNFDEMNMLAEQYQLWWNRSKIHSRHGQTRYDVWLTIKPEQLRTTPDAETLLSLATQEPIKRKVTGDLTASFKGRLWNVNNVPGVLVGGEVWLHWHPFMADTAMAVVWGEDGQEQHIALTEIVKNEYGFDDNAAVIGEDYKAQADTIADTHRKQVQQLAAGTQSQKETEKKTGDKHFVPFNGAIDPQIASKQVLPTLLPKRGTALDVTAPTVQLSRLNTVQMAKWLKTRLGLDYNATLLTEVTTRYPDGATEPELQQVLADLAAGRNAAGKARLYAI